MATTNFNYNQINDADRLLLIQNNIGAGDLEVQFERDDGQVNPFTNFIARIYVERRGGPRQGIFLERFLIGAENTLITNEVLAALAPLDTNLSYRVLARFRPFIPDGTLTLEFTAN